MTKTPSAVTMLKRATGRVIDAKARISDLVGSYTEWRLKHDAKVKDADQVLSMLLAYAVADTEPARLRAVLERYVELAAALEALKALENGKP